MTASKSGPPPEATNDTLAPSQERAARMLAATFEGLWDWDLETDEVTWSDRTLAMLGYDRHSFGGTRAFVRSIIHPSDLETWEQVRRSDADAQDGLDLRVRRADGTYGIFRTRSMVLRGPDGTPKRRVGSIIDVTDVRRQARLLERAEQVGRIGGWELPAESERMYFSAETFRVLGVDPAHFVASVDNVARLFPEEGRTLLVSALKHGLESGGAWELELCRSAGPPATFVRITARADTENGATTRLFGTVQDVTERRRAGVALRESEARYRLLVESSRDLVMELEPDGRIVYVSPNVSVELGFLPADLLETSLLERVHAAEREHVRAQLQKPAASFEFRHVHAAGGEVWLEANASRFFTSDDRERCVLICRNIAERRRIENQSRESSELFAKAFRASPNANSITDVETGEVLEVNEGFTALFGYGREEAVGKTTSELGIWIDPAERQRFIAELKRAGFVREFRTRLGIRDGRQRTCLVSAESVRVGDRSRLIGVVVDVTERDEAERALRESEEKFSRAFRVGPHAMMIVDLESNLFVDVNESFERLSGQPRKDIIGRSLGALGRASPAAQRRLLGALEREGFVQNMELEFTQPSGEPGWLLVSAEVTELHGRRHGLFSIQDISERRRIERAKMALEDQLRHVQKMEAIGTLAGGIAHDFNNILGAMLAYTEIAKLDGANNPAVLESLDEVRKAGARAKDLVKQILTFSRRTSAERKPIRLQPIVAEAMKLLRSTLPATIQLIQEVDADAGLVAADSSQLHQVLVNLCTNAAHAMQGHAGQIVVRLQPWTPGDGEAQSPGNARAGKFIELSVSDTGHGMDSSTLERIFEPFFTTKKPGDGTGLGLSVVHGIIEEHGGSIHVDSEPGRGTTFHVLLPVRSAALENPAADLLKLPYGHGEHILFIDDEPVLCAGAKKLLEKLNYVVTTETSAPAAVSRFKADPSGFDLVLTDLTMPAMSGVDVATELLRTRPDISVVLATGFNANLTIDAVRTLGIRELVAKPLSVEQLAMTVHAALQST